MTMIVGDTLDPDLLRHQKNELRHHAQLRWIHWLIVAGSFLITGIAWHFSQSLLDKQTAQRFERDANDVVSLVQERLQHYEDALLAGVATIQSRGGEITREEWRRYATLLRLPERYPGIGGIGVIRHVDSTDVEAFVERMRREHPDFSIHPDHAFESHLPIVYIEPEADNAAAVGLDVAFETHRREAALSAMTLRTTQVSGPIQLVQDSGKTPGFLFYAPYYHDLDEGSDAPKDAAATIEPDFGGFVYAPLVVENLIAGVLGRDNRNVTLAIRDGDTALYEEADESSSENASLVLERDVKVHGRVWSFEIHPASGFGSGTGSHLPLTVLICGLFIDTMLLALFWLMARSNRKVLNLAERMTNGLITQAQSLAEANDKLASFAHVASHDLKSPLLGLQSIVGFLEEDLEDYLGSENANPDVLESLDFIRRQARKGGALVDGILQYSIADAAEETQEIVDSRALIEEICESVGLAEDGFELHGDLPVFRTYAVRFGQVLQNLIGNAVKYHHDPSNAHLRIGVSQSGDYYHFEIEDDGPGIEAHFHERIFEAFVSLNTRPDVDSSGIGLSIVKKSVESLGGSVTVRSELERGTTFRFDWPMELTVALPKAA